MNERYMGKQVNVRMSKSGSLLGIGIRMEGDERMGAGRGNNIGKQALHVNITELCQDTFYTFTYTLIHSLSMLLVCVPPTPTPTHSLLELPGTWGLIKGLFFLLPRAEWLQQTLIIAIKCKDNVDLSSRGFSFMFFSS